MFFGLEKKMWWQIKKAVSIGKVVLFNRIPQSTPSHKTKKENQYNQSGG